MQKEGCDGLITRRAGSCTGCRRTCAPSASSSSARRGTRCRRSSRSRTTCSTRRRSAAARILAGLEHLDERYLKAVGYATKSQARRAARRWCCSATSSATTRTRSRAPRREVVRIANARGGEGFVAVSAEARKKFWLDRTRTAAIAKHTNAFKINEDVVIPLTAHGRVHRRHRAHQHRAVARNKLALADALEAFFARGNLPLGQAATTPSEIAVGRAARRPRRSRRSALLREVARQWRGCARDAPACGARHGPDVGDARRARLRAAAGPHAARLVEDAAPRAAASDLRRRARSSRSLDECQRDPRARCCAAACSSRCTCTPATATCTPTSRSTPTTTRCCRTAHAAVARIMELARALDGVISGEHGIGITKLEFLTDEELAPLRRLQAARRSRRAASTRASCCATQRRRCRPTCTNAYTPSLRR